MPKTPVSSFSTAMEEAVAVVKRGGVVALPFERLFGLAADGLRADAVARVAAIKGRGAASRGFQPISVIAPDLEAVGDVVDDFTPLARRLAKIYWPGPLTILLKAKPGLAAELVGETGLVGVRVPGSCPAAELAARSGTILTATSANRHGGADALGHEDLTGLKGVDLIIEGRVPGPPGSTVVDASGKRPNVIRFGCIDLKEVC